MRWFVLTVLSLLVAGVLFLRFLPGKGLEQEIEALRKAGLPTSPAELNAWYPRVPDSNNAALVVVEAAKLRAGRDSSVSSFTLPDPGKPPGEKLDAAIETYLKENEKALELVHEAAQLSETRYPIDISVGFSLLLPALAEIKGLTQLLRYEGIYYATRDKPDRAFRSITNSFALARTLRNEPLLISSLVRIACTAISVANFEYVLSAHPFSEDQLRTMMALLKQAEIEGKRGTYRALVGERAGALPFFTMPSSQLQQTLGPGSGAVWQRLLFDVHRMLGLRDRDLGMYLELTGKFTSALTNPLPAAVKLTKEADSEMDRRLSTGFGKLAIITRMVLPAISKSVAKEAALATRLRLAQTAVAIELYRLEHTGALPKTLNDLAPAYLSEPLRDAAEDQPFEFTPLPTGGYTLTSPAAAKALNNKRETVFKVAR